MSEVSEYCALLSFSLLYSVEFVYKTLTLTHTYWTDSVRVCLQISLFMHLLSRLSDIYTPVNEKCKKSSVNFCEITNWLFCEIYQFRYSRLYSRVTNENMWQFWIFRNSIFWKFMDTLSNELFQWLFDIGILKALVYNTLVTNKLSVVQMH